MSWQTFEAVRDYSEARHGQRIVAFVLASHADKYGNGIFIGLETIMAEAKLGRKAVIDGRRWLLENGEAEEVDRPDGKAMMRGRVRVLSLRPLMERARLAEEAANAEGAKTEPLDRGAKTEPQGKEGAKTEPAGVRSTPQGVRSVRPSSSDIAPESEGDEQETEGEPEDARAGARDGRSISDSDSGEELREKADTLSKLEALRAETSIPSAVESLERRIAELKTELGEGVPV